MSTMDKMRRTNAKIRKWLTANDFQDITFFPHTHYQKDLHFQGQDFDGIASLGDVLVLFQAKTNTKATKQTIKDYDEISKRMGILCYWINAIDRKGLEVNNVSVKA